VNKSVGARFITSSATGECSRFPNEKAPEEPGLY
jgi:hypothetical protein